MRVDFQRKGTEVTEWRSGGMARGVYLGTLGIDRPRWRHGRSLLALNTWVWAKQPRPPSYIHSHRFESVIVYTEEAGISESFT